MCKSSADMVLSFPVWFLKIEALKPWGNDEVHRPDYQKEHVNGIKADTERMPLHVLAEVERHRNPKRSLQLIKLKWRISGGSSMESVTKLEIETQLQGVLISLNVNQNHFSESLSV